MKKKMGATFKFELKNIKTGEVKAWEVHNILTTVGREKIGDLVFGLSSAPFGYLAVGTGTTPPTVDDAALETEYFRKAVSSVVRTALNVQLSTTFLTSEANCNISELGIFNDPTAGQMLDRVVGYPITKTSANELTITCTWLL